MSRLPSDIIEFGYAATLWQTLRAAEAAGARPGLCLVEECARLGIKQPKAICRCCNAEFGVLEVDIVPESDGLGPSAACRICGSTDLAARRSP